jgi:hypothetical protein
MLTSGRKRRLWIEYGTRFIGSLQRCFPDPPRQFPSFPGSAELIPGYGEKIPDYIITGIHLQDVDLPEIFRGRSAVFGARRGISRLFSRLHGN